MFKCRCGTDIIEGVLFEKGGYKFKGSDIDRMFSYGHLKKMVELVRQQYAPDILWKKDLFMMLYGSYPIWCIDRNRWEAFKNTFVESYRNLSPWLQKIGYDEMVNFCFITSDGKIQKSDFSSRRSLVVNFSESDYIIDIR